MDANFCFRGGDGLDKKIRMIAGRCSGATRGMPRTLLLAITAPDPTTTPDCEHAEPRACWINQLDMQITFKAAAEMIGAMQGLVDMLENQFVNEFGDEFREAIDDARGRGHSVRMNMVPTEPVTARPWPKR